MPFVGAPKQTYQCPICQRTFQRYASQVKQRQPKCSRHCNGVERGKEWALHGRKGYPARSPESRARSVMYGPKNPAWKGGVTFFKTHGNYTGVRYVRAPEWAKPMARADGYLMEHRLIMAEWCGFLLTRTEVVNHLDHKPGNNERTNLELWPTNADHKRAEFGRCVSGVANRLSLQESAQL